MLWHVWRLAEVRAVGLDFLEHRIAVEHVEHRDLSLEFLPVEPERPLRTEIELVPPIRKARLVVARDKLLVSIKHPSDQSRSDATVSVQFPAILPS